MRNSEVKGWRVWRVSDGGMVSHRYGVGRVSKRVNEDGELD